MKKTNIVGLLLLIAGMTLSSCSNLDESMAIIKPAQTNSIYSETFLTSFGSFTSKTVSGAQVWGESTSGYAMMTGYVSSANNANEDWLISPEIDLSTVTTANVSFEHCARYFGDVSTEATIWVLEGYATDSLPTTSTKMTKLSTMPFTDPGSWTFISSGQISLTAFAGKKVKIAFKYLSTATKAGTWEVKNFTVSSGEAVNKDNGSGLINSPYTISGALSTSGSAWVSGYIVGYVNTASSNNPVFSSTGCTINTNVLIADSVSTPYLAKCLVVDLSNVTIQTAVNLVTNPANLGRHVKLYGQIGPYLSLSGLTGTSYYVFDDGTTGGILPPDPIFSEKFSYSLGQFTTQNVLGAQIWAVSYSAATMTGYVSPTNYANEDWLISPQIDLTNTSNAFLTFDHAARYFNNPATDITVWISDNYVDGTAPSSATWTQLPTSFVNASNWTFGNAGKFSLSAYANKKIKIALKYVSGTKAGTWEVKNFLVYR